MKNELDLSSIWSWTLPLWGLFLVTLFLGSLLTETVILEAVETVRGGGRRDRRGRR